MHITPFLRPWIDRTIQHVAPLSTMANPARYLHVNVSYCYRSRTIQPKVCSRVGLLGQITLVHSCWRTLRYGAYLPKLILVVARRACHFAMTFAPHMSSVFLQVLWHCDLTLTLGNISAASFTPCPGLFTMTMWLVCMNSRFITFQPRTYALPYSASFASIARYINHLRFNAACMNPFSDFLSSCQEIPTFSNCVFTPSLL